MSNVMLALNSTSQASVETVQVVLVGSQTQLLFSHFWVAEQILGSSVQVVGPVSSSLSSLLSLLSSSSGGGLTAQVPVDGLQLSPSPQTTSSQRPDSTQSPSVHSWLPLQSSLVSQGFAFSSASGNLKGSSPSPPPNMPQAENRGRLTNRQNKRGKNLLQKISDRISASTKGMDCPTRQFPIL